MTTSVLSIAISATISAGREILKIYNHPAADFSVEKKVDNSPLTIADKAAHQVIQEHAQMVVDMTNMIKESGKKVYKL